MCLMVYVGTQTAPRATEPAIVGFDDVEDANASVRQWFSEPCVRRVGVPAGNCSCAFRSALAEGPLEWSPEMWDDRAEEDLVADRAIGEALRALVLIDGHIELYAVWNGDEDEEPVWRVDRDLPWLTSDRFFVQENMFYRIVASQSPLRSLTSDL